MAITFRRWAKAEYPDYIALAEGRITGHIVRYVPGRGWHWILLPPGDIGGIPVSWEVTTMSVQAFGMAIQAKQALAAYLDDSEALPHQMMAAETVALLAAVRERLRDAITYQSRLGELMLQLSTHPSQDVRDMGYEGIRRAGSCTEGAADALQEAVRHIEQAESWRAHGHPRRGGR
jgi:hypothetical protein